MRTPVGADIWLISPTPRHALRSEQVDFAWWPHKAKDTVASYRLRCAQIVDELSMNGVSCGLYERGMTPKVLVLSKRYDEASVAEACALRDAHGTRVILDLCDNHFSFDGQDPEWRARSDTLKSAVAAADLVTASTETLADVIREACPDAGNVIVIGDAAEQPFDPGLIARGRDLGAEIDLALLSQKLSGNRRRLVWFGNHGSGYASGGMLDLRRIYPLLEKLDAETPLQLTIISNSHKKYRQTIEGWRIRTRYLRWRPTTFSRALRLHELCLIPIGDNPFTRCKTNNRVAAALLHNLPVVADAIPAYEVFADAVVLNDWEGGLRLMLSDRAEATRRCAIGQALLAADWTLPVIADRWLQTLRALSR